MQKRILTVVLLMAVMAVGCGRQEKQEQETEETVSFTSMEEEPDLSYEVPVSTPGILVNQLGYLTDSAKVAVFTGNELPKEFHVIDRETGETVYTGFPKEKESGAAASRYDGYGDFSSLTKPGTYYIEAPVLGRSYTFEIADNVYGDIFREACKQYYYNRCGMTLTSQYAKERAHNACHTGKAVFRENISQSCDVSGGWHQDEKGQKDVVTAAKTMAVMMLSYELYGQSFSDDVGIPESGNGIPDILDEIRYEAEWLLKMQDQTTGAVYAGVTVYRHDGHNPGKEADAYIEPATDEAEKAFAMAMAKFSYLYQNYDAEYATVCLKAADRAFKYAQLDETAGKDELGFAAAAELYRAAGQEYCLRYVNEYLRTEEFRESRDEVMLVGSVTYISTKRSVNIELCEKVMNMMMDETEIILKDRKNSMYSADETEQGHNDRLLDLMYLAVMNHIIASQEYENVIEDYLHYFLGRNKMSVCYIEGVGENDCNDAGCGPGIMTQFEADSKLIFVLSEVNQGSTVQ